MPIRAIKQRLAFLSLLVLVFCAVSRSHAQIPTYGNLQAQEYGDAVYRQLGFWANIGLDYNHTGVFGGVDSGHVLRVMEAKGEASIIPTGDNTTVEVDLSEFNGPSQTYFGAYTKSDLTVSFAGRKSIVATAASLVNAYIPYVTFDAINYFSGGNSIGYISEIRCDAVVEYSYEANGYIVWWPSATPAAWNILSYPNYHNDAPTPPSDPSYEFSPWAQRGAPGHSPTFNTYMTRPSVINLPTYQLTQVTNAGYADVTIQATDESGIHFIGVVKPGETNWTYSPTQSQHPTSDSYSWTVRITNSGTLRYAALDNGFNAPTAAQTPSVTITVPPPDTTKPTVLITNPAANARFTNDAVVAVQGAAADNVQIAAINCQLNGGGWNAATGTTNWQTTLTLAPGTNVFQVFSVDSAGNNSLTNSRNFVLVLTAPIVVQTSGAGTVSPNYNGQLLEISRGYTVTATPVAGFAFNDWTGRVNGDVVLTTNEPALSFLMQSNLVLTATFVDTNRPVVKITTPLANQRWSNSVFTARGTATDNGTLTEVWYQLNSGDWTGVERTGTNWSADLLLSTPGTNSIRAFAVDAVGIHSLTSSVPFVYVLSDHLQVTTVGKGTLSPNYSNALLELGRSYTVTATAAAGYGFTNWTGRLGEDVVFSTNKAALGFIMQSNLALTATFVDVQKPVLAITAPTLNQRWSNSLFTVAGKVTDNGPVANVSYQLNGTDWVTAESGNLWSNWTAAVTLTPGTNTLLAFATDAAGSRSLTNTVKFVYVLTAPLNLTVIGKGKVNGATNGQPLEIGKSIVLTTTPGTGFVLTNWLVQVNGDTIRTTNKAVPFIMQSNLTLTATFADVVKPVLTITAPTLNQRWSNAVFTAAGKVTDNGPVAVVTYQLNGADWATGETANGWSNWTASLNLTPGTNSFRAFATDAAGNRSLTNSTKVIYVLTAPLGLQLVGKGTVGGATNGQRLEIGKSIALTATPGAGNVLTNWLVQVDGNTIRSTNKAVPFIMQSNLMLTATFADVVKPVLTITSPTLNQRWSNAVFTAAGKVTDNGPVAGVSYQLNSGDWNAAQTANGWSNWTASLNLTPGTNTLRAFATDAGGNRSLTNSQKLIYVPTYWLPDYYYPVTEGNRWIYDGADGSGSPAQLEVRMDNTNFPIVSFTGTAPVSNYTHNVIKVQSAYGSYDSGSGIFTPYEDWSEYITLATGWGIWGSDDSSESLRIDHGFIVTNRLAVGQTASLTRSAYTNGLYAGQATAKLQLLEVADVTVPAGVFAGCLHVRITFTLGGGSQAHDDWLASTAGLVKKQGVSGDGAAEHWALSYYLPAASRAKAASPVVAVKAAVPASLPSTAPGSTVTTTAANTATVAPLTAVVPVESLQFDSSAAGLAVVDGVLHLRLTGPPGAEVVVESSPDLLHWQPVQNCTLTADGVSLAVPAPPHPAQFFRARLR